MVSHNTTLVPSLRLRIGPACEAGLSAGMRRERVPPRKRKKKRKKELRMQTLREQGLGAKTIISSYSDKGWKLSTIKKVCCRVNHTGLAVCVNQAVGDLPQHLHAWYRTLTHIWRKNDVSFLKSCIFIFWVNRPTQNLTGWKRWVLVEKLTPFDEILR